MDDLSSKSEPDAPQEVQQTQDVQQTPRRSKHKRVNSGDTERPTSAQRDRRDGSEEVSDHEEDVSIDEDTDPADEIEHFDWEGLHGRYHDAIKQFNDEEDGLMGEWASLMEYFRIWANAGHAHETDRTFQRLQTRTMYVQNEEEELERKRIHYTNVVKAFESALDLLKANDMRFRG